jgi:hypothetical protein
MRTYGRNYNPDGTYTWAEVSTDASGYSDAVYLTTLCQVLQGSPGESPFYANYGIPGLQSAQQQVPPDYYVALTQSQFAPYFANLQIQKIAAVDSRGVPYPAYKVTATTHQGATIGATIPS